MTNILYPNEKEFDEIITNNDTVLVDFFASWCGPCKMLAPEIEKLANEYQNQLPILKVDIDQQIGLAQRYGIQTIPTLLVFKKGTVVKKAVGYQPYSKLKQFLGI